MAQSDFQQKEIEGFTYKVMMLDPLVASDLLADLGFVLAPAIGALGGVLVKEKGDGLGKLLDGTAEESDEDSNIDDAVEKAVIGLFGRFSKAKQRELISILQKVTIVVLPDGKEPRLQDIFTVHFRGRLKSLYLWLAFALKVQYQDFFSGMNIDFNQLAQKMTPTPSSSQNT